VHLRGEEGVVLGIHPGGDNTKSSHSHDFFFVAIRRPIGPKQVLGGEPGHHLPLGGLEVREGDPPHLLFRPHGRAKGVPWCFESGTQQDLTKMNERGLKKRGGTLR